MKRRTEVCQQRGVAAAHGGVKRLGALDGGARLHASERTLCVSILTQSGSRLEAILMEADWAGDEVADEVAEAPASSSFYMHALTSSSSLHSLTFPDAAACERPLARKASARAPAAHQENATVVREEYGGRLGW